MGRSGLIWMVRASRLDSTLSETSWPSLPVPDSALKAMGEMEKRQAPKASAPSPAGKRGPSESQLGGWRIAHQACG